MGWYVHTDHTCATVPLCAVPDWSRLRLHRTPVRSGEAGCWMAATACVEAWPASRAAVASLPEAPLGRRHNGTECHEKAKRGIELGLFAGRERNMRTSAVYQCVGAKVATDTTKRATKRATNWAPVCFDLKGLLVKIS